MAHAFEVEEPKHRLLLPPEDASFTSEVYSSLAEFAEKRRVSYEFAGRAFHAFQRRASGLSWEQEKKTKGKKDEKAVPVSRTDKPLSGGGDDDVDDIMMRGLKEEKNYYAILGIAHLGLNASEKQIKKAYQEMILKTHPDKISQNATKEELAAANALFRDVQKAYEVLSDVEKRRGYDSQFEFDDKIPTGYETLRDEKAFFELYGPVFAMNARFSVAKPVPLLGSSDDDEATVKDFYNFWRTFRTWRDFSAYDEFKDGDIETAESRDHRRWMIKKNEAQREKLRKKEFARIQNLAERAFKNDPRIARFKAEAEQKKLEAAQAREAAKKAVEDAKRAEEERIERERLEQERLESERREAERKLRAEAKQARKKAVKSLIAMLSQLSVNEADYTGEMESLAGLDADGIKAIEDQVTAAKSAEPFFAVCKAKREEQEAIEREEEAKRQAKAQEQAESLAKERAEEKAKKTLVWTTEALSFLAKGMAKFPGGTRNRWQCIATFVGTCGFTATAEDCIEASKKLAVSGPSRPTGFVTGGVVTGTAQPAQQNNATQTSGDGKTEAKQVREWTADEQKLLEAALKEFPNTMEINERWTAIAAKVGTRTKKECAARVKELKAKATAAKQ